MDNAYKEKLCPSLIWNGIYVKYYIKQTNCKKCNFILHYSRDKLFNTISRTKHENFNKEAKEMIKKIAEACTTCHGFLHKHNCLKYAFL